MYTAVKKCVLLIWLASPASVVFAQSNYQPAIVIDNNGDSLTGKVDYRNWKKNPETINFIHPGNQKLVFDPSAIKSFYLINEKVTYISHHVTIDNTPDNYLKVVSNRTTGTSSTEKNVFLLELVKGEPLSLYTYTDNNRSHFYYSIENEKPVELIYHFLYVENSGEVETITAYKQQLLAIMSPRREMTDKVSTLHYTEKELIDLFLYYLNGNNTAAVPDVKRNTPLSLKFGVVGGLMYNRFRFVGEGRVTPNSYSDISIGSYSSNRFPVAGVSLDLGLQPRINRWHLINELIFKTYKTSNTSFTHTVLYDYTTDINLSFSYIQLNTLLRYIIPIKANVKPFINVGLGNGYSISENQNYSHVKYSDGREKTTTAIDGPVKYERSKILGAGVSTGKLQLEGRYAFSNGFSPYVRLLSKVNSTQIIFTYQF